MRSLPLALFLYARRGRFSRSVRREEVRILACYKIGQIKIPKSRILTELLMGTFIYF
nr:MAG TPA: hypothetical protein [Caudoviricetes sp.]